jgi:hypothetical protein
MENNQSRRNLIKFIPGVLLMLWATRGNAAALAGSAAKSSISIRQEWRIESAQ